MRGRHCAALVLGLLCAGLVFSCAQACPPVARAQIGADFLAAVRTACKGYHSLAECPEAERLKAERTAAEFDAGCR